MDLISFMKTALYKIIVIVTIATMVFTTLGIQPVGASTSIPETLHPVEQLNVQKDSNGALTDASPYSDPDIFSVSYNYNYVKNMYMTDLAAIKFTVDTSRPILSAQLTLSGINEDINNEIFSNLTVRIGDNDWNSNFQNSDFPDFIHGTPAKVETVEINDGGYTYQNLIDVTNLVTSPSAISGNNVTFILTSDSSNMSVAKLSDSLDTEVWPSLKITYGEAQQNSAPTDITLSSASVEENQPSGTTVGTLSAIDSDAGDTFTYSLVSGAGATDNSSFSIVGNELRTSSSFDYETKNSYSVQIKVTDKGGLTFEKVFTILISNVNEAPTDISLSADTVAENQPLGTKVGTFSAIDSDAGDTFTYSLVSGVGATDNSSFSIVGNELRTSSSFDYETKNSYSVRIKVTDKGGLTFEKVFTILISNVNEAPTDISLSADTVAENQPSGTKVGTFSATDSDAGNTFTYSLVSGAGATDNSSFSIVGNELRTTSSFDFETKNSYSVRVRVTDQGGLSFEKPFTISVTDIIEAPIPTIVSTVPVNNATNVSTKPTLTLNFSKAISGVAGKHLRIYDQHDSLIESIEATSTKVTLNGSSVSIQISSNLTKAMTYYVLMDNGAFVDIDNQEVAGITANNVWRFTTLLPSNNADLSNLTVSTQQLNPSFSSGQLNYQVNVAHDVTTIDVIPTTTDSNATITLDGESVANAVGKTISLNVGNNAIPIIVTAENGLTTKTYTINVTRALLSLEKVTNVNLSTVGIATWSDIDNESLYEVQLYKDSQPIGSAINVLANKTAHNFLAAMRAAGAGVYTVKVTPKGDGLTYLDGDTSASSNTQAIIKLATVTDSLRWDGSIAKWQSVPNAVSYDVLLYKDSAVVGTVKNILAENIQDGVDFTAELQLNGIGSYTFTVQPKGDGALILDGNQGTSSEPNIISPVTYTVMYNGNGSTGGTAPIDSAKYGQNADVVVSANDGQLVKTGHIFTGWNTKADGTGTYYSPNESFKMGTENVTLFAQWAIKQFTVSFVSNGGTTINSKQVQYNSIITAEKPVKSGYVFEGWYKDAALTTAWNFVSDVITENITLYAKWGSINTGGGNTNPPANNSGSESTTPPSSEVEDIVVDVESGDGTTVSKTTIKRTKNADGTFNDAVVFTEKSARETIAKLKEQASDKARIVIPDLQDKIKQINVSIPSNIVSILKQSSVNLEIDSINAKIEIPKSSINSFDNDLYFRLIPIKAAIDRLEIENRVKQETQFKEVVDSKMIQLLGRPMTIETNMQNRPVTLTLPLPKNITQEQLDNLAIFIEHSDGTKELLRGKVVDYQKDMLGVQFEVTKFSTFSVLYLPVDEEPTTDDITHTPYIQGYADGTFRPNASVTRAQMASMFARQLTGNAIPQAQASYTDTMKHDAKDAIEFVKDAGLFNGVTETSFNPNGFITRAQMAAVAARWIEKHCVDNPNADFCKTTSEGNAFKDVSNNHWAVQAIDTVYALGIMTGTTADTFNPDGNLTRAQAVKVLNHLFERQAPTELQSPIFKDVQSNHWAFYEIQEAAVKHTHSR
ncbi:cadherin domain-containing protein [Lysinibacillus sp. NPDC097162]|uniref:cadherin domain-containing protein n=1 Tax=Lysinibacillus sp. NPDC097162 TaxID=3364140 RepID=UPI0038121430